MNSISIGYLNIEGLQMDKHQACCSLIEAGLFDVLFLSETWFPKSFNYMSHPYSYVHTPFSKYQEKSRQSGGILSLVSPRVRGSIRSHVVTSDGVLLDVDGTKVLAVYLPPSLSLDQIGRSLSAFSDYSLLLGDINVRFKGISRRPSVPRLDLQEYWHRWSIQRSFHMAKPTQDPLSISRSQKDIFQKSHSILLSSRFSPTVGDDYSLLPNCELDHCFHSTTLPLRLQLLGSDQFNLKTVHPYFLRCVIPSTGSLETELREGLGRFHLELLERPGIPLILTHAWRTLDESIDWDISDVDVYDSVLVSAVQSVADGVLGTYDVLRRRAAPDRVQPFLSSQLSSVACVRLFKRKHRNANPDLLIQPPHEAMDRCVTKFQSLFFTGSPSFPLPPLSDDRPLVDELLCLIEPRRVAEFVSTYPKDKACGIDSVHVVLLEALSGTSFFSRLSGLFDRCVRGGRTPRPLESIRHVSSSQVDGASDHL